LQLTLVLKLVLGQIAVVLKLAVVLELALALVLELRLVGAHAACARGVVLGGRSHDPALSAMGALDNGEADRHHDRHREIAVSPSQHGATRPRMRLAPILNAPSIRNR
jgi:hypothetical protein